MNWYLIIQGAQQAVYYTETPRYTFRIRKKEVPHKILYKYQKDPMWYPINIEFPTRVLPQTEAFLKLKSIDKLGLYCVNVDEQVLEEWNIENVKIISIQEKRSRVMNRQIINIIVEFKRANKVR
jgi:hypothetical protein